MRAVRVVVALSALAACVAAAPSSGHKLEFKAWKAKFGKAYAHADEEVYRYGVFQSNMETIEAHNAKGFPWTMGANQFADMTPAEFLTTYGGGAKVPSSVPVSAPQPGLLSDDDLPSSVDWTTQGVVTPVKNQGQCGSCWTFSTTGSVESINAINGNGLTPLSEQQLVDCSTAAPNSGCNGGNVMVALEYINSNGGLCTETAYPYTAQNGTCQTSCTPVTTVATYVYVTAESDTALAGAIAKQPVTVTVEADQSVFQFYSGGVMNSACGSRLDHSVLAVGYGVDSDSSLSYYKIKNSWGATWGEAGYIRLVRDATLNGGKGQCGILSYSIYPTQ